MPFASVGASARAVSLFPLTEAPFSCVPHANAFAGAYCHRTNPLQWYYVNEIPDLSGNRLCRGDILPFLIFTIAFMRDKSGVVISLEPESGRWQYRATSPELLDRES